MKITKNSFNRLADLFLTFLWKKAESFSRSSCYVLMFHHVTDEFVDTDASCLCRVDKFRETLTQMLDEGYSFISLDDVYSFVLSPIGQKLTTVTFDDVPENVYHNAYPILKELDIPFTLFITTNFIGRKGYLTSEQIVEMSKNSLCTVGAHTETHPMLRNVNNHYEEMFNSKKVLEELLKKNVNYLAYPYGKHSSISLKVRKEAKKIGFKCAFGTIEAPITRLSAYWKYYLPRVIIN